jgi:hypothetical protein
MMEVACDCEDGFGVPHTHLTECYAVDVGAFPRQATGWVRLWVDWKAVARA